jgi:hypothetical protein
MKKRINNLLSIKGGLERSDLTTNRADEATYIHKIEPPALTKDKSEWLRGAFARGVSLRDCMKGAGLNARTTCKILGIDPDENPNLVAELEAYRTNLLSHRSS